MSAIVVQFKDQAGQQIRAGVYTGLHLEIRRSGNQIRFYEVQPGKHKEYCLKKDTVKFLIRTQVLPKSNLMKRALAGDQSIFS